MSLVLHAQRGGDFWSARARPLRPLHDFYPSPPEATRALLSVETLAGSVWECACGDGAIAVELEAAGYAVTGTDLIYRGYGKGGVDFLEQTTPRAVNIITNPPYGHGLADRFVRHALTLTAKTGGTVAMLMNLASLCHPQRHHWYLQHPPAAIYGIDHIVCWPYGDPRFATSRTTQHRYCWMVWKQGHVGRPTFWWLSASDFGAPSAIPSHSHPQGALQ